MLRSCDFTLIPSFILLTVRVLLPVWLLTSLGCLPSHSLTNRRRILQSERHLILDTSSPKSTIESEALLFNCKVSRCDFVCQKPSQRFLKLKISRPHVRSYQSRSETNERKNSLWPSSSLALPRCRSRPREVCEVETGTEMPKNSTIPSHKNSISKLKK